MIYITGDTHGQFQRIEQFCEKIKPNTKDIMIILGDAGFNYYRNWRDEFSKKKMSQLPITIFSIHGNHEMRPAMIPSYHIAEWNSGKVYIEDDYPNLLFAVDGEIYNLNGCQTLAIGGAYSVDKFYRLSRGWKWWEDEQPSPAIKARVEHALTERSWRVGTITVDDISTLALHLENSAYTGAINETGEAGNITVTLDESSTWTLTGDSHISAFEGDLSHVVMGGYQLLIDGAAK